MYALDPSNGKITIIISQVDNGFVVSMTEKDGLKTLIATDLPNALKMIEYATAKTV